MLTTAIGVAPSNDFFIATRDYATRDPSTIAALVDEITADWQWAEHHQAELAVVLSQASGVPVDVEKLVAARGHYEIIYINPEVVLKQQAIANSFSNLGLIPHPIAIAHHVWMPGNVH